MCTRFSGKYWLSKSLIHVIPVRFDTVQLYVMPSDASVDFIKHYQLVDQNKLDMYARAYVVEDDDFDYRIDAKVRNMSYDPS